MSTASPRRRRHNLFLARLANRRAVSTRVAAAVALVATFVGPLQVAFVGAQAPTKAATGALPDDAARRSSQRVRPVALADVNGKVPADHLWRLFDGDAATGLEAWTPVQVRLSFAQPTALDAIGVYGPAAGSVALLGPDGKGAPGASTDLAGGTGRWTRLPVAGAAPTRSFVIAWTPRQPGAVLPELEVWGRSVGSGGDRLPDVLYRAAPEGSSTFTAREPERQVSASTTAEDRTFAVDVPDDPRAIDRAFLLFDLNGLPHFTAAKRAINDGAAVGGFGIVRGAKGGLQVEEIPARALRKGRNLVRFDPVHDSDPVGYRVSGLRIVTTHADDARAAADGGDLNDGKENTGWSNGVAAARRLHFGSAVQPRELEFRLTKGRQGTLKIVGASGSDSQQVAVDLTALKPGWHKVALDALPAVESLSAVLDGGREGAVFISELVITGSPLPVDKEQALRVTYPLHGECVDHRVHVRALAGFEAAEVLANGRAQNGVGFEPGAFSFSATEKDLGGSGGKPFTVKLEARHRGGGASRAEIAIAGCQDRPVAAGGATLAGPVEDVGAPYGATVTAQTGGTLSFGGAKLAVPAGAVEKDARLTVRALAANQVPPLEPGMTNVTSGGRAFRLGPHGMQFRQPVSLTLPVDRARLEKGDRAAIYYYDEKAHHWAEVAMLSQGADQVAAETTHFTDFIAATMVLPEHPGLQSLNPTSLKEITVADPGAGITQIAPPQANAFGTASLEYPITVPRGRRGMQPSLAVTYNSDAGNSWMGMGWDLQVSHIEVDTRFGVPRYDGTERYLLDGEELTPLSAPPSNAPGGTYYALRNEGKFDWIQRITTSGSFHWVITDKAGTKHTYGLADGRLMKRTSSGGVDRVRTFRWALESSEDIYGNQVLYDYIPDGPNAAATGDRFEQLYLKQIRYTATRLGMLQPLYTVVFNRSASTSDRVDTFTTGRPGFQVRTRSLLESIDVQNAGVSIRKYVFKYVAGDFGKNVLSSISQFGKGTSTALAVHNLTYYKVPVDSAQQPRIFTVPINWTTLLNQNGSPSAGSSIRDDSTSAATFGVSIGVPLTGHSAAHVDVKTAGDRWVEDIDGDGLPDLLPNNALDGNKQSLTTTALGLPAGLMSVQPGTDWNGPHSYDQNQHMSSSYNFLSLNGSEDYGNMSESTQMLADINGDGLPDRLYRDGDAPSTIHVMLNKGSFSGFSPLTDFTGALGTGLKFSCSDIFAGTSLATGASSGALTSTAPNFPSVDVVTAWEAPVDGVVRITGIAKRLETGGDGMVASLYNGMTLLWQRDFPWDFTTDCTPALNNGCGDPATGIDVRVTRGQRIYTRVNAKGNADHDVLKWDTTIRYTENVLGEEDARESYGPLRYTFSEANESRAMGAFHTPWRAPATGVISIKEDFQKVVTADDVETTLMLHRPSDPSFDWTIGTALLPATYQATASYDFGLINVEVGDELYLWARSKLPTDPEAVQQSFTATYTSLCRTDPASGRFYCGAPHCTPTDPQVGPEGGTACTIEEQPWNGVSTDPLASSPVAGSMISQVIPAYLPLYKWIYQPWTTPVAGITTVDGRRKLKSPSANPAALLCLIQGDPTVPSQTFTLAVQTVNRLLGKVDVDSASSQPEAAGCVSVPTTSIATGEQVFFSVYADRPFQGNYRFSASLAGNAVSNTYIDRYYRDPSATTLSTFPNFGETHPMTGGFHNFYSGTWNGNQPFDEAKITAPGNEWYVPLRIAPRPTEPVPAGSLSFPGVGLLSGVVHAVAGVASYAFDKGNNAITVVGTTLFRGVRTLFGLGGKVLAWGLCTVSNSGYTPIGMRITETHSKQEGVGIVAGVARSMGRTVGGMDLLDMNGDRYLDQVSTAGIRYLSYNPSTSTGNFGPATPTVRIPGTNPALRIGANTMYTGQVAVGGQLQADSQATDSGGKTSGVQVGGSLAGRLSQGFARITRDLRDVNGDGLPDLVEANGTNLNVSLNYGYSFGAVTTWAGSSADMTVPALKNLFAGSAVTNLLSSLANAVTNYERDTRLGIRLEETGHKGGSVGLSAGNGVISGGVGFGVDQTYVRTLGELVDINGDGLPDRVFRLPGGAYQVQLNTGTGFGILLTVPSDAWPSIPSVMATGGDPVPANSIDVLTFSKTSGWDASANVAFSALGVEGGPGRGSQKEILSLMDIDGDGRLDHVLKNDDGGVLWARMNQVGKSNLLASVSRPMGGSIDLDYARSGNVVGSFPGAAGTVRADMPYNQWALSKVTVKDGRGNSASDQIDFIDYTTPLTAAPNSVPSGIYDRGEREFTGYSKVTISHRDGSWKLLYFTNGSYIDKGMPLGEYDINKDGTVVRGSLTNRQLGGTLNAPRSGLTSRFATIIQTFDVIYDGRVTKSAVETAGPFGPFNRFAAVPSDGSVIHKTQRDFDNNGNLIAFWDFGESSISADDVKFTISPKIITGQHFTGVDSVRMTLVSDNVTTLRQRKSTYIVQNNRPELRQIDDLVFRGNQPGTLGPYSGQVSSYKFTYDTLTGNFGNLETYEDPTGYKLTYEYDTTAKTHVTKVTDTFSLVSAATVNLDLGLPDTTTDANGQQVRYEYDPNGRMFRVWGPTDIGGTVPTIEMTYSQPAAVTATTPAFALTKHKDTTGTIDTAAFADGLGRIIQTKKEAEVMVGAAKQSGFTVSGQVLFDTRGRLLSQSQPSFVQGTTGITTFTPTTTVRDTLYSYDAADRVTIVKLPDGSITSTKYATVIPGASGDDGLSGATGNVELAAVTDANSHVHRTYRDGTGRIVEVKEFNIISTVRRALETKYLYDPQGNVAQVTEMRGVLTASYDSLNRMVRLKSSDAGETEYRYGLNGLVAEVQTSNLRGANQWIKYGYVQNRLSTITYPTSSAVSYTYGGLTDKGDVNGNSAGRIKSVTMEGGKEDRRYDAFGNVAQTTTTLRHINNTTLASPVAVMRYTYDWLGRMRTMTFPKAVDINWNIPSGDGEVVTYTYDTGGMLKGITGNNAGTVETYLADIGYDAFGQRAMFKAGNNIVTTYTYDQNRRFLQNVSATATPSTGAVQFLALAYTYDLVGNVKSITNTPPDASIRADSAPVGVGPLDIKYLYDEQDQLVSSTGKYRGHKTRGYRYSTTFDYDDAGNLTKKAQTDVRQSYVSTNVGLTGAVDVRNVVDTTYTIVPVYIPSKGHQPAAVNETLSTGATQTRSLAYDSNGNQTGDTVGTTTRTLTWNEENRLKQFQVGTTVKSAFLYNPDGERTQRMDAGGRTTFYINQFLVLHGDKNVTKHIYAGETRIVSKTDVFQSTTPVRHFYHADQLGTTSYISDAGQNLVQHERYFPYGESWTESGFAEQSGTNRRDWLFTGKELDRDTDLYYFGARYYDPKTTRWMSTDPVLADYAEGRPNDGVFQPKNLGVYSYAWNNPVIAKDDDGRVIWLLVGAGVAYGLLRSAGTPAVPVGGGEIGTRSTSNRELVANTVDGAHFLLFGSARGTVEGRGPLSPEPPAAPRVGEGTVLAPEPAAGLPVRTGIRAGSQGGAGLGGSAEPTTIGSNAARREAMRQEGIPTTQQPVSQSNNESGRSYVYEVPASGGGTQLKAVQQQTLDRSHPGQGHWEAGAVKVDPITGEVRTNSHGRPKLTNEKSKVNYR